ncbi:MAG: amidohydrolase family protein [Rhizobiaceae bacterium]|nr:amidohydrolase family protein [Rhizobiaceae bacterium]
MIIKNACVLTMDRALGDFEQADILVVGSKIAEVKPNVHAPDAEVIDGSGMIVMPGFIDTHRHSWQAAFRWFAPNSTMETYGQTVNKILQSIRPQDVFIANRLTCYGAIDAGITTMLDWSHVSNTPEHSDAAVEGLMNSGLRAVYGYAYSRANVGLSFFPEDARRIRSTYFSSPDLVTMYMAANIDQTNAWKLARELDLRISGHVFRPKDGEVLEEVGRAGLLGPDVTLIHCTPQVTDLGWRMMADNGVSISLATISISQIGVASGIPPIQKSLDVGIRPSLSIDVESVLPNDFFSLMRVTLSLQRSAANELRLTGAQNPPVLLTARDVLEFATVQGAKALGLEDKIGTLTPGKEADLIMLEADAINTMPLNNAVGTVVAGCTARNIKLVLIAGQVVKWGDELPGVDLKQLEHMVTRSRDWVAQAAGYPPDVIGNGY